MTATARLLLLVFSLALAADLLGPVVVRAAVVEHTFNIQNLTVTRFCKTNVIPAINGKYPGPKLEIHEGDRVIIHVINTSPYNMTIHWHGIFQRGTPYYDGPEMVAQCPIVSGGKYTYNFTVTGQEGTLWYHAHSSFQRMTVYGPLIILPQHGRRAYPFPKPDKENVIMFGEYWNLGADQLQQQAFVTGGLIPAPDGYTINGKPGELANCSRHQTYQIRAKRGETHLLRIINSALNTELFFKIAGHTFTVVAADAGYVTPNATDVIVVAPGQTVDALMVANATPSRYYMSISPYESAAIGRGPNFNAKTTVGIVEYDGADPWTPPEMPDVPAFNDTNTANAFYECLTPLQRSGDPTVPLNVDISMFITFGVGFSTCVAAQTGCNTATGSFSANMNNNSFVLPSTISMLEAQYRNVSGVYTTDFPDEPAVFYDFTNVTVATQLGSPAPRTTKVRSVPFNSTLQIVLQNTASLSTENHPIHLHGFNFFVLAQGTGNYNATKAVPTFNFENPLIRNTVAVPTGGWSVIRFVANNPGIWFTHCHIDAHILAGLGMAFEVLPAPGTTLPPPPPDYPQC